MYELECSSRVHRLCFGDACFGVLELERRLLKCVGEKQIRAHTTDRSVVNQQMYLRILLEKPAGEGPDGGHRAQVHLAKQNAGVL